MSAGDSDGDGAGALLFYYVLLAPFGIPHLAVEKAPEPAAGWSIASPPYSDGAPGSFEPVASPPEAVDPWLQSSGLLDSPPSKPDYEVAPDRRRIAAAQVAAEAIPPVAGVARVQASVRLQTVYRLELDAAYALYVERTDASVSSSTWSGAWLGHAHVTYQFARSEHVQFRAGAGVRHWVDARGAAAGFDVLYGVDIFPVRPLSVCLEFTGGTLGNAWVSEPRATAGWILGLGEVFVGYDGVWVGGRGPTAFLGGPVGGLRMYF